MHGYRKSSVEKQNYLICHRLSEPVETCSRDVLVLLRSTVGDLTFAWRFVSNPTSCDDVRHRVGRQSDQIRSQCRCSLTRKRVVERRVVECVRSRVHLCAILRVRASCVGLWLLCMRASCVTRDYIVKKPRKKVTLIYLFHGFLVFTCRCQVQSTCTLRFVSCLTSTEYDLFFYLYGCAQYFVFFTFFIFLNYGEHGISEKTESSRKGKYSLFNYYLIILFR
jgi:hypothetical protein